MLAWHASCVVPQLQLLQPGVGYTHPTNGPTSRHKTRAHLVNPALHGVPGLALLPLIRLVIGAAARLLHSLALQPAQ